MFVCVGFAKKCREKSDAIEFENDFDWRPDALPVALSKLNESALCRIYEICPEKCSQPTKNLL